MASLMPALFMLCVAATSAAQAPVDLNSLATAAGKYAEPFAHDQRRSPALDLRLLRGDNGGNPALLMTRASDVQRWTIFFNARYAPSPELPESEESILLLPRSASVKCLRGVFSDFFMATASVPDCKSLENTWLAITLDGAIAQLNANGYSRGFSQVETLRPDLAGYPDETVYVFTCPPERTEVAISANTGALTWHRIY